MVHIEHIQHRFYASQVDHAWFIDITEHPTRESDIDFCAVKNSWSNRIVGLSIEAWVEQPPFLS